MRSIRTVRQAVEEDADNTVFPTKPRYAVGDYMEIYCGRNEGHCFWIRDVRWNYDVGGYQYARDDIFFCDWLGENSLVLIRKAPSPPVVALDGSGERG